MSLDLINWLLKQLPTIIVMGVVCYFLYKKYQEKDRAYMELSEKVVRIATLYEEREENYKDSNKEQREEIMSLLKLITKALTKAGYIEL